MGEPWAPLDVVHVAVRGLAVGVSASMPLLQGTNRVAFRPAEPPSAKQKEVRSATCPLTPPRLDWLSTYAVVDLPTSKTRPLDRRAGVVEPRSASPALALYQSCGAKESSGCMVGLSFSTLSLWS